MKKGQNTLLNRTPYFYSLSVKFSSNFTILGFKRDKRSSSARFCNKLRVPNLQILTALLIKKFGRFPTGRAIRCNGWFVASPTISTTIPNAKDVEFKFLNTTKSSV
jgi:hypothetical protein